MRNAAFLLILALGAPVAARAQVSPDTAAPAMFAPADDGAQVSPDTATSTTFAPADDGAQVRPDTAASATFAPADDGASAASSLVLTGHARVDLVGQSVMWDAPPDQTEPESEHPEGWRSPWLAGGFSLVIPGSGQIYAGNWWKAAIFLAVEAAAVTYAVVNNNKGNDQTAYYEGYAEAHWDVVRYGQWTEDNLAPESGEPYLWNLGNGQVDWNELNRMERAIGSWYSHTLPPYQSQQYYELIGKYPQFAQGWDDAQPNASASYEEAKAELSYNYMYYSGERGKANEYYSKSSTGVVVMVVNHLLSAADAAWTASSHNKGLNAGLGLQAVPPGARSLAGPAVKLSYGF